MDNALCGWRERLSKYRGMSLHPRYESGGSREPLIPRRSLAMPARNTCVLCDFCPSQQPIFDCNYIQAHCESSVGCHDLRSQSTSAGYPAILSLLRISDVGELSPPAPEAACMLVAAGEEPPRPSDAEDATA